MKKVVLDVSEKEEIKKIKEGAGEFKKFISRGNVVDMAVGVIIGGAFGKVVTSLVQDMLMPLIGVLLGGLDFSKLKFTVGSAVVAYGSFLQAIVDFLIISFSIFIMIKVLEKFKRKNDSKTSDKEKSEDVLLLEEIRDLLKEQKKS